jgi:pimeloyl-ACP methyl ester carboxylesterase
MVHNGFVVWAAGPAVVLLHGFPELWYSWRHQMPALAEAGFHAIALDMRGYGESEAPVGIETILHFMWWAISLVSLMLLARNRYLHI